MNRPSSRLLRGCLLALGSAGTLTSIDASAQTTTSGLEEIIVTAQRRELNLQNTAISASVLSGDKLDRQGRHRSLRPAVRGTRRHDLGLRLRERVHHPRHRPQPGRHRRALRRRDLPRWRADARGLLPERAVLRHRQRRGLSRAAGHVRRQERGGRRGVHQHARPGPRGASAAACRATSAITAWPSSPAS